jgi:hypothetical protein
MNARYGAILMLLRKTDYRPNMTMPTTDEFRAELHAQIERTSRQGRPHVEINAGELHRKLGGYPPKAGPHSMRLCVP